MIFTIAVIEIFVKDLKVGRVVIRYNGYVGNRISDVSLYYVSWNEVSRQDIISLGLSPA